MTCIYRRFRRDGRLPPPLPSNALAPIRRVTKDAMRPEDREHSNLRMQIGRHRAASSSRRRCVHPEGSSSGGARRRPGGARGPPWPTNLASEMRLSARSGQARCSAPLRTAPPSVLVLVPSLPAVLLRFVKTRQLSAWPGQATLCCAIGTPASA